MNPTQINEYVIMTTQAPNIVKHNTQHPQQRPIYNTAARRLTALARTQVSASLASSPVGLLAEEMRIRQGFSPKRVGRPTCLPTSLIYRAETTTKKWKTEKKLKSKNGYAQK